MPKKIIGINAVLDLRDRPGLDPTLKAIALASIKKPEFKHKVADILFSEIEKKIGEAGLHYSSSYSLGYFSMTFFAPRYPEDAASGGGAANHDHEIKAELIGDSESGSTAP